MADEGDDERGFFAEQPLARLRKPSQTKDKPHYLGHRDRLRERFTTPRPTTASPTTNCLNSSCSG